MPAHTKPSVDSFDSLAPCLALLRQISSDLALVAERWDSLPGVVRAGIVAMIRVSGDGGGVG
jgi:hypothetical protein